MYANLKDICKDKEMLKYLQSVLRDQPVTKGFASKLEKIIRLYEEVETDLELGTECIISLDMPRLEAIKERDKMLLLYKKADDI